MFKRCSSELHCSIEENRKIKERERRDIYREKEELEKREREREKTRE